MYSIAKSVSTRKGQRPTSRASYSNSVGKVAQSHASHDARSGTRTRTPLRERDFKSLASTGFAIPATPERAHRARRSATVLMRAGNGTRTRDPNLGKVVLYQLSYSRVPRKN